MRLASTSLGTQCKFYNYENDDGIYIQIYTDTLFGAFRITVYDIDKQLCKTLLLRGSIFTAIKTTVQLLQDMKA